MMGAHRSGLLTSGPTSVFFFLFLVFLISFINNLFDSINLSKKLSYVVSEANMLVLRMDAIVVLYFSSSKISQRVLFSYHNII